MALPVKDVFERNGNSVQKAEIRALAKFVVGASRSLPRIFGHNHMIGIDRGIYRCDAVEAVFRQLDRSKRARANCCSRISNSW